MAGSDMIHGPSIAIGAGITAAVAAIIFVAGGLADTPPAELITEEAPPVTPASVSISTFIDNGSPVLGDPDAPLTMVEFGDYQCHFCNVFYHDTEGRIISEYVDSGKLKMIFKDFTIIGPDSVSAAHGAHCAGEQGKFWEYHDTLYENWSGENTGWASAENLQSFAEDIDLDLDRWGQCMADNRYESRITTSNEDAEVLGVTGTPAFFVIASDNTYSEISGAQSYDVFSALIESELARR